MSDKRIIKVNPDLFKIPDNTKKKREPKQPKEIKIKAKKITIILLSKRNYLIYYEENKMKK